MTKAIAPDAGDPKPTEEAAAPTFPVRPPAPTATFAANPQTTASKLLGWLGIGLFILLFSVPGIYPGRRQVLATAFHVAIWLWPCSRSAWT